MTTVTPLPTPAPSRDQTQAAFNSAANALFGALPTMVTQINTVAGEIDAAAVAADASADAAALSEAAASSSATLAQDWATKTSAPVSGGEYSAKYHAQAAATSASSAINAPGTSATSTTSLTIGTGSKSLTIQAGKQFAVGQFVVIASTASPSNYMSGQITAYNSGTGALTVNVGMVGGSGTLAAWTVALGADSNALPKSGGTLTGPRYTRDDDGTVSGGTWAIDYNSGPVIRAQAGAAITSITVANWPASGAAGHLKLMLVNFGAFAITFPAGWLWVKSDLTTTTFSGLGVSLPAAGACFVDLVTVDGGTTVYAYLAR